MAVVAVPSKVGLVDTDCEAAVVRTGKVGADQSQIGR